MWFITHASCEVLRAPGEHEFRVPPLAVPDPAQLPRVNSVDRYEAVQLFQQRAEAASGTFAITAENA